MKSLYWNRHFIAVFLGFCVAVVSGVAPGNESECSSTQFQCDNGRCISLAWHCDSEDDCHDLSDELNCTSTTCGSMDFRCESDGKCIPIRWKCDDANDCADGSDEFPKTCSVMTCNHDEYRCKDNQTCIEQIWVCDGEKDCSDGDDEENCTDKNVGPKCNDSQFRCVKGGQCIIKAWICDGNKDCLDGSDEKECSVKDCKSSDEFKCPEKCIQNGWVCDGDSDCEDGSDEKQNCEFTEKTCSSSEFQCKTLDRMCINLSWKCDGDTDCEDSSDEKNCNITCKQDEFLCDGTYCINSALRCDGQQDCINGSDEENCPETVHTCPENQFDCNGDGLECLDYKRVCDKWKDCKNSRDEHNCTKNDLCKENNGGCQHVCYRAPDGRFCSCHHGFQLVADSETECEDVNECLTPGVCSQICINNKGSYQCQCSEHYKLERGHFCRADLPGEPQLLLADRKELRRYHLVTKMYSLLINNSDIKRAIAMDFHISKDYVYWTDDQKNEINRVHLKTNVVETVISKNVSTPDGLAVDWVHGHLYWTDSGTDRIEVATLDGKLRKVVIEADLDEPRAIAVDPRNGRIYWTDWGAHPKIECSSMNGNDRKIIVDNELTWPMGLTIDYGDNKLYWLDSKTHRIESSNMQGQNRRLVLRGHQYLGHPFGISVFEDHVYWSDWPSESIRRYNKFGKGLVETVTTGLDKPMDIHIYHPNKQIPYDNVCESKKAVCEHFCLPEPEMLPGSTVESLTFTCECMTGYTWDHEDHTKCVPGVSQSKPTRQPTSTQPPTPPPTTEKMAASQPASVRPTTAILEDTTQQLNGITDLTNQTVMHPMNMVGQESMGHVAIIGIAVVLVIAFVIIVVLVLLFRRHRNRNIKSMNFDNPVYRKTTTADDDKVYVEKSSSRQHLPSSMQPLNPTDNEIV